MRFGSIHDSRINIRRAECCQSFCVVKSVPGATGLSHVGETRSLMFPVLASSRSILAEHSIRASAALRFQGFDVLSS